MSTRPSASFTRSVMSSSAWLGSAMPTGWLCATMTAAELRCRASLTIIVKLALQRNSAAVIVAHNHPVGIAEPSQADELITLRVKEALGLVDIRLLDHIIVGDGVSV